jgi:hypothetical protein
MLRYKRAEDARMALEQMEGFELAGRTVRMAVFSVLCLSLFSKLRVNTVHEKGTAKYTVQESLDDAGGRQYPSGFMLHLS